MLNNIGNIATITGLIALVLSIILEKVISRSRLFEIMCRI